MLDPGAMELIDKQNMILSVTSIEWKLKGELTQFEIQIAEIKFSVNSSNFKVEQKSTSFSWSRTLYSNNFIVLLSVYRFYLPSLGAFVSLSILPPEKCDEVTTTNLDYCRIVGNDLQLIKKHPAMQLFVLQKSKRVRQSWALIRWKHYKVCQ